MLVSPIHQRESAIGLHMSASLPLPTPSHPSRLSQSTVLSSLHLTANSHWLSILHTAMYFSMLLSQFVPSLPSPLFPQVCSLCLHLCCCPTNRLIRTIFLDSMKWTKSCSVMSNSLRPHGLYSPWNSPAQNIGVGSLSLLQVIFPTQGSKSGLLHCRQILPAEPQRKPPRVHIYVLIYNICLCLFDLLHSVWQVLGSST